jgi:hypothetical protein
MLLWRRALPLIAVLTLANPVLGQHATVNTERELCEALIRQRAVAPMTVKIIAADGERSGGAIAQLTMSFEANDANGFPVRDRATCSFGDPHPARPMRSFAQEPGKMTLFCDTAGCLSGLELDLALDLAVASRVDQ